MMSQEGDMGFYQGQRVVAVNAIPGARFKNGQEYVVAAYEYRTNPVNGLKFWYIDIVGHGKWFRPSIFAPIIEAFQKVSFEKIVEQEPLSVN